ncbi:NADase-type glycan-binding domain-containing protein [Pseudodesulfovibrio portus]|nr:hypothetical protein [Pseudodesulfovibrio portus]
MPMSNVKPLLLGPAALLLAVLVCVPALGAPVDGVEVTVRNHEGSFVGANLIDNDPETAWVGGGTGVGPGKWIEFTFPADVRLDSLRVANGHQGKGRFDKFRRLTRGVILYPDETRQKFTLKPVSGVQTIRLEPKTVRTFRVIITGVAPAAGDEAMGKAKVAVSEMTVFGEIVGAAGAGAAGEANLPAEVETAAGKPDPVAQATPKPKGEKVPGPIAKAKPAVKPKPAAKAEAGRTEPAEAGETAPKKAAPVDKAEPVKPASKPAAKTPPKKIAAKKIAAEKPVSKKSAAKPKPKAKAGNTAAGSVAYLRPVTEVPADKPLQAGVISPWLDLELVAGIKRFLSHLTTLSDSFPDVLASAIREKERGAFLSLQAETRKKKEFNNHHIAMLELIGLNFDKPVESGGAVSTLVHGPCRYYVGDRGYEFQVNALFTLVNEGGTWLISGVRDK